MTASQDLPAGFARRHIGPSARDIEEMLAAVGVSSIEKLMDQTLAEGIRQSAPLEIGDALSEAEALARVREMASHNQVMTSLIGMGYYGTILPPVIERNVLENPAWYTAYTPYQPEISQGRLEALLNFQTMICDLTGMDVSNASLLDEATAAAEAMALARRSAESASMKVFADRNLHPQTIAVLKTRAEALGWTVVVGDEPSGDYFCGVFQYPGTFGEIRDFRHGDSGFARAGWHRSARLRSVGSDFADAARRTRRGHRDRFHAAVRRSHGVWRSARGLHRGQGRVEARAARAGWWEFRWTAHGNPAYRLALQAREQHIRREKATSNICTAQVLLAVIASFYAVYHGPEGLTAIAREVRRKTAILAAGLERLGYRVMNALFFDTITVAAGGKQKEILDRARVEKLNLRMDATDAAIGVSLDETTTPAVIEAIWRAFGGNLRYTEVEVPEPTLPAEFARTSAFLTHPVFHRYRTETEMLRYIRRLGDRDLALDRTMIPLGSCTMKLNATAEMFPISWPEWNSIHPFAPLEQTQGYQEMFRDLEQKLCAITGYDAVSLQPNSGAQGEFAGLLAIRGYHRSRGEPHRNVCLIPSSAHGTNPASAHMAGMEVEVVEYDPQGNIDLADLTAKAERMPTGSRP